MLLPARVASRGVGGGRYCEPMTTECPRTADSRTPSVVPVRPEPTAMDQAVLTAVRESWRDEGRAPTMRAIARRAGISSTSTVQRHVRMLLDTGRLRRVDGALRVVEGDERGTAVPGAVCLPILDAATVPAGGGISVPVELLDRGEHLVVTAADDAMDPQVRLGDRVVVRRLEPDRDGLHEGDLVAAVVDGRTVVRTVSPKAERVWLMAATDSHAPVDADDATVLGRAVALMRRL